MRRKNNLFWRVFNAAKTSENYSSLQKMKENFLTFGKNFKNLK